MIHATRNGAKQAFTEHEWALLPKHKFGWVEETGPPPETTVPAAGEKPPNKKRKK